MKIFINFFTFILFTYQLYPQWNQENFYTANDNLFCTYFLDQNTGWISGGSNYEGYLYKTINGGTNWTKRIFPDTYELESIYFINESKGWAVGDSGIVITTSDGGDTWYFQNSKTKSHLSSVYFIDENNGWICYGYGVGFPSTTYYGVILYTTNGGGDWNIQKEVENYQFKSIYFIDNNTGWAAGSNHQNKTEIYITNDGGSSWIPKSINTIWRIFYSVHFADNLTGWLVGESGIIMKTIDGGNTWFPQTNGYQGYYLSSCYAIDQNRVYTVGRYGYILFTNDGGVNWIEQESGINNTLNSIFFTDEMKGWAVGYDVVLSTTNGGVTFIEEVSSETPTEYMLSQNYPNPFNPTTTIVYSLPKEENVKIIVYDITGRIVNNLINEIKPAGNHSVLFNADSYASGTYFYQLKTSNFTETKNLILLR